MSDAGNGSGNVTVLPQITQVGKPSGTTDKGNYREDLWMRIREINFPKKSKLVTVVITTNGYIAPGVEGTIIATSGPVNTASVQVDRGGLGAVGGLAAKVSLTDTDLSHFFTLTTEPDGSLGYISYQAEVDFVVNQHPGAVVIKGEPTGHDSAGNSVPNGGEGPYFVQVVILAPFPPANGFLERGAVAITVDDDNPGALVFAIGKVQSTQTIFTDTADLVAYEGLPHLEPQADGTIKVSAADPGDGSPPAALNVVWSASVSQPSGSTTASTLVRYKITDTALL